MSTYSPFQISLTSFTGISGDIELTMINVGPGLVTGADSMLGVPEELVWPSVRGRGHAQWQQLVVIQQL